MRASDPRAVRRAALVMVALVLVWGYAWILTKLALAYCGPLELATLRAAVGTAALLPALVWISGRRIWPQHPWQTLLVGMIQTALFLVLNTWALSQGEPGKTSILVFTMPFWVLLFAWPGLGERIQGPGWLAVGLAAVGLLLILDPRTLHAGLFAKTLAVLAGICWALGVVVSKHLHNRHRVDVFNFTFWQMALGMIPMAAVAVSLPSRPIMWSTEFVLLVLSLGVVATAGGWGAWFYVLRRLPAGTTSMASLGVPVVALGASALQLGERPTPLELSGMIVIGVALALLCWDTIRRRRPVAPLMGQE